jgi:hypothetical protein
VSNCGQLDRIQYEALICTGPCQRRLEPLITYIHDKTMKQVQPSVSTLEEVDFPSIGRIWIETILTHGRGSACWVLLHHQHDHHTFFLGIQHSKTPSQRNKRLPQNLTSNFYWSSFYVFETTPPCRIVAQSGWFCLRFPSSEDDHELSLLAVTSWRKLVLGRKFDCPHIHFVCRMTLNAGDPNTVISHMALTIALHVLLRSAYLISTIYCSMGQEHNNS